MNLKPELQKLNNKLDKCRRKLTAAEKRYDDEVAAQAKREIAAITVQIQSIKGSQAREVSSKGAKIQAMAFNRALTKAEQADMGKLKKTVRGIIVVHPLTALGRELEVTEVTGFARKPF